MKQKVVLAVSEDETNSAEDLLEVVIKEAFEAGRRDAWRDTPAWRDVWCDLLSILEIDV